MEKHFLDDQMDGKPGFRAEPWYNPYGDCVVYQMANEAILADRIDGLLTIYRSMIDERPIGFQIKGVGAIIRALGLDGLVIAAESDSDSVRKVSIMGLLLAAYDRGPSTVSRRQAYTEAAETQGALSKPPSIPVDELVPA